MTTTSRQRRPIAGWAAVIIAVALVVLAVVIFGVAQNATDGVDESGRVAVEVQLLDARRDLELSTLDVIVVRMLDAMEAQGDRSERLSLAVADVRSATARVAELAEGDGDVAAEAATLYDDLYIESLDDPANSDLQELFYVAEESARYFGATEVVTTQRAAIQQLSFVVAVPLHVMVEGIAADVSVNDRTVDPASVEFVDYMTDVVRTEGGWFGANAATPLVDSPWIEIDEAREMLPAATAALSDLVAASQIVEYDAWMRELGDGFAAAPIGPVDALRLADELQADMEPVIEELFADEQAERDAVVASQQSERRLLLGLSAVVALLAGLAFAAGVVVIARVTRASRERAEMALRDSLTGIGNRHELEERTRRLTTDPRFGHHVVVMIDLDRFKMVNDVHGHAAGDAILIEVAAHLQHLADGFASGRRDVESTVVRLGGDEFLLTVHGTLPFDVAAIRAGLDGIRGRWIDHVGERIALGFSVGIVHVAGQHELADLMSAADLAVYDDKALRAHRRKSAAGELPPSDLQSGASFDAPTR